MIKKYLIVFGFILALILLITATLHYPGGSQKDQNSIGYDWKNNYLSNLFSEKAVNGSDNTSRIWAVGGMFFLCASFGLFFIHFSKKIPDSSAANIVKYVGVSANIFAFLAVTQYHDTMVTLGDTLGLISMFYITVYVFKAKLFIAKILSLVCLLTIYAGTYIYYTSTLLEILPIVQKTSLALNIIWVLWLEYNTRREDFKSLKKIKQVSLNE